ncbi:MAG: hypothetical protein LBK67_08430, partial [Coriobacteriales bacterium]|nr:hypothetical protein [Coriobacteriales bacterium]
MELTRRSFLKGGTVFAVGALGAFALNGCSSGDNGAADLSNADTPVNGTAEVPATFGQQKVVLHRGYFTAHTPRAVAQAVVAVDESGKILACDIEDYQFMDPTHTWKPVPNSDGDFGKGYANDMVLISKKDNSEVMSEWMVEMASSTQPWIVSMTAIEDYAVGKMPDELTAATVDAVSGATLVDTDKYLKGIAAVATDDTFTIEGVFEGDPSELKFGHADVATHGTDSFADIVSLVHSGIFVGVSVDEFQFVDEGLAGLTPVPNSDDLFGESYYEGLTLISKSINSEVYTDLTGATESWLDSMVVLENSLVEQKVSDASVDSALTMPDADVYLEGAVSAAESA